jgi:hypothetical protein
MLPSMSTAGVPSRGQGSYRPVRGGGAAEALPCTMGTQGGPPPLGVALHTRSRQRASARGGRWGDEKGEYNG